MGVMTSLIAVTLVTAFVSVGARRLFTSIHAVGVQTFCLAGICVAGGLESEGPRLYVAVLTMFLTVKAIALPVLFRRVVVRLGVSREIDMLVGVPGSMLLATVLVGAAYATTRSLNAAEFPRPPGFLAVSVSLVLLGLLIMAIRRKVVTQLVGLLQMENGAFLAAMTSADGLPVIVDLGVFMDLLIVALLAGVVLHRVRDS